MCVPATVAISNQDLVAGVQAPWRWDPLDALVVCKRVADAFALPAALALELADHEPRKRIVNKGYVLDPGEPTRHRVIVNIKAPCVVNSCC